ncbi:MAG: DJ-1/PfpI family protein [Cyclobacteriaceae bacterium]
MRKLLKISNQFAVRAKYAIPIWISLWLVIIQTGMSQENQFEPESELLSSEDSLEIQKLERDLTAGKQAEVMNQVFGQPKYKIQTIGVLVYDGVNDLDMIGPRYILGSMGANTQLISVEPGSIKTVKGIEIIPDNTIDSVHQLDILVIPGGAQGTVKTAYNPQVQEWIRKIDRETTFTASVCTGGWILGASGLLEGKQATTNWYRAEEMLAKYGASFTNERFTQDGKYWTSAGVTAGMDMSLAIMKELWGENYTQALMLDMEYDPAPPMEGGSPQKTNRAVHWMLESMYDAGLMTLIDSLENNNQ